jgi:hypothetical protein
LTSRGSVRHSVGNDSGKSWKARVSKLLKVVLNIFPSMAKLSDEKRAELLVELDKTITEMKSLAGVIRVVTDKLENIMRGIRDDVFTGAERLPTGTYSRNSPVWEPSEFNLAELKKGHLRLRELIEKRNVLEGQLGFTVR